MCLKSITRVIENPTFDELVGYKVVFVRGNLPQPAYFGIGESYNLPVNQWLISDPTDIRTEDWEYYVSGFHIFTSQDEAVKWGGIHATHVIEVKYRLVTYHGTEEGCNGDVHIAREMYIPWPQTPVRIK